MGEGGDFGFETATGLPARLGSQHRGFPLRQPAIEGRGWGKETPRRCVTFKGPAARAHASVIGKIGHISPGCNGLFRSEERRVGKEGVSTCRYRWSPVS